MRLNHKTRSVTFALCSVALLTLASEHAWANRYYAPGLGRFISRDPAAARTSYDYVTDAPSNAVDPLGLAECNCPPWQCALLAPINDRLNDKVNQELTVARIRASLLPLPLVSFGDIFWHAVAQDQDALATKIERWIQNQGDRYVGETAQTGVAAHLYAKCIRVECERETYCIGDDKIGHLFQQGRMLYDLKRALERRFPGTAPETISGIVEAWSASTEGFELGREHRRILENLGSVDFYGFTEKNPLRYFQKWGGRLGMARSEADLAANRAGLRLWEEILRNPAGFKFDICNYLEEGWLEPARDCL